MRSSFEAFFRLMYMQNETWKQDNMRIFLKESLHIDGVNMFSYHVHLQGSSKCYQSAEDWCKLFLLANWSPAVIIRRQKWCIKDCGENDPNARFTFKLWKSFCDKLMD